MKIRDYLPIQDVPIGAVVLKENGKPDHILKERARGCTRNHVHINGSMCYDRGYMVLIEVTV